MRFISEKLKELIKEGKLLQVVIVDSEGFVIDAVGDLYDPEILSSVFIPLQHSMKSIKENLEVNEVEELSLRTGKKDSRIIFRNFTINDMQFSLISVCPISSSYRQIMTEIIRSDSDDILQKALRKDVGYQFEDTGEKKTTEPMEAIDMLEEMKEPGKKEVGIEEKGQLEISDEIIDLISNKVLKKLFYEFIDKMTQEKVLKVADDLIKKEIEKAKKEFNPNSR